MNDIDPTSLLAVVQTDPTDGRLLCPQCGGRLYLAVTRVNTGVPAWRTEPDDDSAGLDYDPDEDGGGSEQSITDVYCDACRWNYRAPVPADVLFRALIPYPEALALELADNSVSAALGEMAYTQWAAAERLRALRYRAVYKRLVTPTPDGYQVDLRATTHVAIGYTYARVAPFKLTVWECRRDLGVATVLGCYRTLEGVRADYPDAHIAGRTGNAISLNGADYAYVPDPEPDEVLVTHDATAPTYPWDVWLCGPDVAWRVASYGDLPDLQANYPTFTLTSREPDGLTTPRGRHYPDRATCACGTEAWTVDGYGPVVCPECQGAEV